MSRLDSDVRAILQISAAKNLGECSYSKRGVLKASSKYSSCLQELLVPGRGSRLSCSAYLDCSMWS